MEKPPLESAEGSVSGGELDADAENGSTRFSAKFSSNSALGRIFVLTV